MKSHLPETEKYVVHWFRRDLRLDDNSALLAALMLAQKEGLKVMPLFVFDTNILFQLQNPQDKRVNYIHQQLEKINQTLQHFGSALVVKFAKPQEAFDQLTNAYQIVAVYTNEDYEPYAIQRDNAVKHFLMARGIAFKSFTDHVIFKPGAILKADQTPYTVYTPFSKSWKQNLAKIQTEPAQPQVTINLQNNFWQPLSECAIPPLSAIGFKSASIEFPLADTNLALLQAYAQNRNLPGLDATSKVSLSLRFGTISIRHLVNKVRHDTAADSWLNELIWREFFFHILYHFPHVVSKSFKPAYDGINWRNNEADFERWKSGTTGYPMVDAGMRQLNQTGWMHNRVRMVVASFLCKHLLIDWRWGEAYFAEKLLDFELASNNGNWQWAAGSGCDAAPYFRIFNPSEQQRKFDPDHTYIKRWVPDYNTVTYPLPIVDHAQARLRALSVYKAGLQLMPVQR